MRKHHSWLMGLVLAVLAPFAMAYDLARPRVAAAVEWVVGIGEGIDSQMRKFDAELIANYGNRTGETARVNGMLKDSNGYLQTSADSATCLPDEVGWQTA